MDSDLDFHTTRALLEWQLEMGVNEATGDTAIDRYKLDAQPPRASKAALAQGWQSTPVSNDQTGIGGTADQTPDAVAEAETAASGARDLLELKAAMDAYTHCPLKSGARSLVFADGIAGAPLMIVGEAPGRDEDREGKPFVGRAGQLLDKMLAAIDMGRTNPDRPVYISNVLPWRPPQNRTPEPDEIAMLLPFLKRHIELAAPKLLVLMGNTPCQALLGRTGITRMRGTWTEALGLPVLPMFHPAYLLRTPAAKRESWADLLDLNAKLKSLS